MKLPTEKEKTGEEQMKYKNGALSAVFGITQQLLTLIFGLIVPRLFIRTYGSEMNGLLSSLGNIYTYLALVEAGVGTASIQALYAPLGRNDRDGVNSIMAATANYYNRAGWVYLLGVIGISILYPLTVTTTVQRETIALLSLLQGIGGVINFWVQGKYMVLLQAEGKKYLMSILTMVTYVLNNLMKVVLLNNGYNVIAVHIGGLCISLAQMLFWMIYIRKNYRWLDFGVTPNSAALNQSNAVFVAQITGMICNNTDILVLTYVVKDLKAVSVYNVYLMIFGAVERLFSTLFGSFHYLLGQKYNTDREGYMTHHRVYEGLSMTGAFALYTIAFLLTEPFMRVYTAGITDVAYVDPYLPVLFTVMHLLSSGREASARVINFAGHFRQMQGRAILESGINLVMSILLVTKLGIYGVLLGTIAAYLYRTNDIILYANRQILHRKCWNTYGIWLSNLLVFFLICGGFQFITLTADSFAGFFLTAIPVGISVCVIYFATMWIFERDSARFLLRIGKKMISIGKRTGG